MEIIRQRHMDRNGHGYNMWCRPKQYRRGTGNRPRRDRVPKHDECISSSEGVPTSRGSQDAFQQCRDSLCVPEGGWWVPEPRGGTVRDTWLLYQLAAMNQVCASSIMVSLGNSGPSFTGLLEHSQYHTVLVCQQAILFIYLQNICQL